MIQCACTVIPVLSGFFFQRTYNIFDSVIVVTTKFVDLNHICLHILCNRFVIVFTSCIYTLYLDIV